MVFRGPSFNHVQPCQSFQSQLICDIILAAATIKHEAADMVVQVRSVCVVDEKVGEEPVRVLDFCLWAKMMLKAIGSWP